MTPKTLSRWRFKVKSFPHSIWGDNYLRFNHYFSENIAHIFIKRCEWQISQDLFIICCIEIPIQHRFHKQINFVSILCLWNRKLFKWRLNTEDQTLSIIFIVYYKSGDLRLQMGWPLFLVTGSTLRRFFRPIFWITKFFRILILYWSCFKEGKFHSFTCFITNHLFQML